MLYYYIQFYILYMFDINNQLGKFNIYLIYLILKKIFFKNIYIDIILNIRFNYIFDFFYGLLYV